MKSGMILEDGKISRACRTVSAGSAFREDFMAVLSNLEPKAVFEYFEKLCAVPHGSGNTKIISDLCVSFAKELGLKWRQDELNNVVIWKDGTPGYEDADPVILQGHMDMVCAKTEDCPKDMAREGLDLATDGEYVWAKETSLGGDNCIAVAMALAILADKTMPHPPLEAVFTVDEEVGMEGAFGLDCSDLKGRQLLNLDSEEEGIFTVSCAGGVRMDCMLPGAQRSLTGETGYAVTISGLQGATPVRRSTRAGPPPTFWRAGRFTAQWSVYRACVWRTSGAESSITLSVPTANPELLFRQGGRQCSRPLSRSLTGFSKMSTLAATRA